MGELLQGANQAPLPGSVKMGVDRLNAVAH
jgi:hypothetical protein